MNLEQQLKQIHAKGLNIYALLYKLKQKKGWKKDRILPKEVIEQILSYFKKHEKEINNPWQWFMKALDEACMEYYANQEIKDSIKNGVHPRVKKLITHILKKGL